MCWIYRYIFQNLKLQLPDIIDNSIKTYVQTKDNINIYFLTFLENRKDSLTDDIRSKIDNKVIDWLTSETIQRVSTALSSIDTYVTQLDRVFTDFTQKYNICEQLLQNASTNTLSLHKNCEKVARKIDVCKDQIRVLSAEATQIQKSNDTDQLSDPTRQILVEVESVKKELDRVLSEIKTLKDSEKGDKEQTSRDIQALRSEIKSLRDTYKGNTSIGHNSYNFELFMKQEVSLMSVKRSHVYLFYNTLKHLCSKYNIMLKPLHTVKRDKTIYEDGHFFTNIMRERAIAELFHKLESPGCLPLDNQRV